MEELTLERNLERDDRGNAVRAVQEWLSLNGFGVLVDGHYGPATEFAVRSFQTDRGLAQNGKVQNATFQELVKPMQNAVDALAPKATLGETVAAYGLQHRDQGPREIGGQNLGTWVRLYMDGNQGSEWPWCAGFVSFVLAQACDAHGVGLPIVKSFSCDVIAMDAKDKGRFLSESGLDRTTLRPGYLFLNRRTSNDWTHIGIVLEANPEVFLTIEGNTNDDGDREGYEVCRRIRGYRNKDFVRID